MGQIDTGGGKGRKVDVDLNLVPFIDLMSVLITFLLITAVWTQVSMIQIGSSLYGKKSDTQPAPVPPPLVQLVLKVDVKPGGYSLTVGQQNISIPLLSGEFDLEGLKTQLIRIKNLYPEKQDIVVSVSDELAYNYLITTMDVMLKAGFPSISIATGGPI